MSQSGPNRSRRISAGSVTVRAPSLNVSEEEKEDIETLNKKVLDAKITLAEHITKVRKRETELIDEVNFAQNNLLSYLSQAAASRGIDLQDTNHKWAFNFTTMSFGKPSNKK
jgi:hypothetical protein